MNNNSNDDCSLKVDIPIEWLLILAVHGNMGDGEIPDIMKRWAKDLLIEFGYESEYTKRQEERLLALTNRLKNVLGDAEASKAIGHINRAIGNMNSSLKDDAK
ncbi:MAG: hypothetical protein AAGF26_17205 [Cyanobacteria bacterium P01_G01_bin.49]